MADSMASEPSATNSHDPTSLHTILPNGDSKSSSKTPIPVLDIEPAALLSSSSSMPPPQPSKAAMASLSPATRAIHADDHLAAYPDVSPAMHVSTTFRYTDDPEALRPTGDDEQFRDSSDPPAAHIYSRLSTPNTSRLEATLSALLNGRALTYSSGLAAFHALLVFLNPKRIVIGEGYHGCHGVVAIMQKLTGMHKLDLHDETSWDAAGLGKGDVIHVETPLNPTGEASDLSHYAALAHARGAYLTVDATFGPPGLQDPFLHGADAIMHSGTKYFGGHSDMLCGVLAVRRDDWWTGLWTERLHLGSVMGSFEGWLGLRSIRTLELRVMRQSASTEALVTWLDSALRGDSSGADSDVVRKVVARVSHASLQKDDMHWLRKQMPRGYGPVFALWAADSRTARRLPSKLRLFHHATSLGGVESLVEWRRMSDPTVDERLLRFSVGVEAWEDLKEDLRSAFVELASEVGSEVAVSNGS